MKSRIILAITALLILGYFVFTDVNNYIEDLNNQIEVSNERIEALINSDSIVNEKTKEYSKTITKYVNDCSVSIGEKSYSLSDFIELYVEQIDEKTKLKDSLFKLNALYKASIKLYGEPYSLRRKNDTIMELIPQTTEIEKKLQNTSDSLTIYRTLVEYVEDRFDLKSKYNIREKNISYYYEGVEKLDSALLLLPYYKNKISSEGNTWKVKVDNEFIKSERKQKRLDRRESKN